MKTVLRKLGIDAIPKMIDVCAETSLPVSECQPESIAMQSIANADVLGMLIRVHFQNTVVTGLVSVDAVIHVLETSQEIFVTRSTANAIAQRTKVPALMERFVSMEHAVKKILKLLNRI